MKTRGMIEVDTSQAEKLEQLYGRTVEGAMIVVFISVNIACDPLAPSRPLPDCL